MTTVTASARSRTETGLPAMFVLRTPSGVDVAGFYRAVLGWELGESDVLFASGRPVARLRTGSGGWMPYLATDDLDATLEAVTASGGSVLNGPNDVVVGRVAAVADATGAAIGLVEEGDGMQPHLLSPDSGFTWIEEKTRDQPAATGFWSAVFGYPFVGPEGPGRVRVMNVTPTRFGGVMAFDDRWSADHPPHWLVYAAVDDADAAAARVVSAGGTVWLQPTDTPLGRIAYIRDPSGADLAIVAVSADGRTLIHPANG